MFGRRPQGLLFNHFVHKSALATEVLRLCSSIREDLGIQIVKPQQQKENAKFELFAIELMKFINSIAKKIGDF